MTTRRLSETDIAYCAAVLDNLAVFRQRGTSASQLPVIQISGKLQVLSWLGQVTGTKVIETRRGYTKHMCTQHCPDRHADIRSTSGRWSVTGMRATIVLTNVLPYLRFQRQKAQELIDLGLQASYQGQVVNEMSQLGWSIPELPLHARARVPLTVV